VHRTSKAALVASLCTLAVPAAAHAAATKTVYMGMPAAAEKSFNEKYNSDANAYFPSTAAVHVGDKIRFVPTSFHTVDLVPKGGQPLPLISSTGQKADDKDAAGNPFWFTGTQDQLGFTPALGKSLYGKTVSFNGTKRAQSGLPLSDKPAPFTVKFTKAGTFTYFCNVHAGMKGTVRVLPASKAVPSAAADAKAVKRQISAAITTAKSLAKTVSPANTVSVGASGPGGVEYFGFFPSALTVPTGSAVTFTMSAKSVDVHTATTGPGNPETDRTSYLGQLSAGIGGSPVFPGAAAYPSDPPGTPAQLTPTSHGNGFWNSGVLDNSSATQLPSSNTVTFAAPGTYQFYCLIHPFMHATVTVQ
jgi:plastocyanin